ncbi:MAG: phage tail protein [Eubacteriales bacterium]|nr:phage tail protein [Eubacteriales bacterium]MDD3881882.1 phage tail protein [Eubacteriales bacterium]MDD4512872.1 phage tail protein [Eubacteriales bacterium]
MINFHIEQLTPKFLLRNRTARAIAKSIETALTQMCGIVSDGVDIIADVSAMPEWRLDEMAWETNCLYDYEADITNKRVWIRDALPLYRAYGTPVAIVNYLSGFFDDIEVEEWHNYNADPFHFRVTVSGVWTNKTEQWARKAITNAKNVRSVLDDIAIGSMCKITISGQGAEQARFPYPMTGGDAYAGTRPLTNTIGILRDISADVEAEAGGHRYPYRATGTVPQQNIIADLNEAALNAGGEGRAYVYPYPQTDEARNAGTHPGIILAGAVRDASIAAEAQGEGRRYPYPLTGTTPQQNITANEGTAAIQANGEGNAFVYPYPQTSEEQQAGTHPITSTLGAHGNGNIRASPDIEGYAFPYTQCGDSVCGDTGL